MQPDPEDAIPAVAIIIDLEQSHQTGIHQGVHWNRGNYSDAKGMT